MGKTKSNEKNSYKILVSLSMIYMSIMLCSALLTHRYVGTNHFFILGGTLISPLLFLMDDIVAEIYGYKMTRFLIIMGFISQFIFMAICLLITSMSYPIFFENHSYYSEIFGWSFVHITLSGSFAYIVANLTNAYLLTKWKVLLKGRRFWLRSIGSSVLSEGLYSFIAIMLMQINAIPLEDILRVIVISYAIKIIYNCFFAGPATVIVNYLKAKSGVDVYDFPKELTPFNNKNLMETTNVK